MLEGLHEQGCSLFDVAEGIEELEQLGGAGVVGRTEDATREQRMGEMFEGVRALLLKYGLTVQAGAQGAAEAGAEQPAAGSSSAEVDGPE